MAGLPFLASLIITGLGAGVGAILILWRRAAADGFSGWIGRGAIASFDRVRLPIRHRRPLVLIPLAVFLGLGLYALTSLPLALYRG